jgi:hypothetical protein
MLGMPTCKEEVSQRLPDTGTADITVAVSVGLEQWQLLGLVAVNEKRMARNLY